MGLKSFILKQAIKHQTRNLPDDQRNLILQLVEKNPEIFEKMAAEMAEKKKQGIPESTAQMQVMLKYRGELQKLAQDLG